MQSPKGYDVGEVLGELPAWTFLAATSIVGLIVLRIVLKPKAPVPLRSAHSGASRR